MSQSKALFLLLFLFPLGILTGIAYNENLQVSPHISVPLMTAVALTVIFGEIKISRVSFLPRVMMMLYIMPFLHLWGYIFYTDYVFSPLGADYQRNPKIYTQLALVGLIGAVGLSIGFLLSTLIRFRRPPIKLSDKRTLGIVPFVAFAVIAYLLSASSHPVGGNIFSAPAWELAHNLIIGNLINFNGGFTVSYVMLSILVIDTIYEFGPRRRRFKKRILFVVVTLVIVLHNILTGDRVVLGLILALMALYVNPRGYLGYRYVLQGSYKVILGKLLRLGVILGIVYVTFQNLNTWRDTASLGIGFFDSLSQIIAGGHFFSGTWTAVLLTPLSIVGDLVYGLKSLRWGETYLDMLLSLPPGPLASILGYERPYDETSGLAPEMRFFLGGEHAVVAPLLNFSAFGVLVILALWGCFFGRAERVAQRGTKWYLLFYMSLLTMSYGWAWYGPMWLIRGIMSAYIVWWVYKTVIIFDNTIRGRM